ncbi:MAG: hypothetical protein LUP95_07205 [Euryarchaeota archaeon]|nr:hypothetical protein [Euryarchaeota archaeon]
MTLTCKSCPFMKRIGLALLPLSVFFVIIAARPVVAPAAIRIGIRYQKEILSNRVNALTILPGKAVTFEVIDPDPGSIYVAQPTGGKLVPLGTGRWVWTSPSKPGLYPIQVLAPDSGDKVTLMAFVLVPFRQLRGEFLNGYRIGRYPKKTLPGLPSPAGFIEVTKKNEDLLVSPNFRLKQFLCKQPSCSRKYLLLNERLPLALEYVLERAKLAGYRATTFHIMSGYRTPSYNFSLGNVRLSAHQWGAAADIFIDEDGDGVMDDLNGDGVSDIRDAEVLYQLIDDAAAQPEGQKLIGGIGKYPSTAAHGPFVHVDIRERQARW